MKVLIFADSHGYNMAMAFAVDREEPDAVIHLGDHAEDAREIERVFPAMPICRVRGNNDFDPEVPLNAVVTPGGVRIYITHGHRERVGMLSSGIVSQRAYEEHCALAFFGHTHRMMLERENGVWVCNPGSISLPRCSSWSMRTAVCCEKRVCKRNRKLGEHYAFSNRRRQHQHGVRFI